MNKGKLNFLEKIILKFIDNSNRNTPHTNPEKINDNIYKFREKISKKFAQYLPKKGKGVDIGAGKGIFSKILFPRTTYNLDIDFPKDAFKPKIKGNAENLPFKDSELDYALVFYSFHHFEDTKKALSEIYRVLKKDGTFIAMIETLRFPKQEKLVHLNEMSMERIIYKKDEPFKYVEHKEKYFTKKSFEKENEKLGFKIISSESFKPTKRIYYLFKTQKTLYIMKKG